MSRETELIPEFTSLEEIYDAEGLAEANTRYDRIRHMFEQKFGSRPEVFGRSPGRVNIIGEHIDYEGYGVLPMAIAFDTVVAVRKAGGDLHIANLDSDRFQDVHFQADPSQAVDTEHHTWANYLMCAYKGVHEHLEARGTPVPPVGLQLMVHGTVPAGAGVSSSSALVCAASLALLGAYGVRLSKVEVAEFTCACERYVGTQSGGMDQAISIMGQRGLAKMVDFNPIRTRDVKLPHGFTFVIANSLAVSNKAETADARYNLRVVECRLASACLAAAAGQRPSEAVKVKTLFEAEQILEQSESASPTRSCARLAEKLEIAAEAAGELLHEGPYSKAEIEEILGAPLEQILDPRSLRVVPVAEKLGGFQLRARALHVFAEAARVRRFGSLCEGPQDLDAEARDRLAKELGELMDASHTSLNDLYNCSCPELEELVSQCRAAGALGSRLTGAGWGGCAVSMVSDDNVEGFVEALRAGFYAESLRRGRVSAKDVEQAVFVSKPSAGGAIIRRL